jgi:FlgD Ig-like domain
MRSLLLFIGCLFCFQAAGIAFELVDHPRIYINKEILSELALRATGEGMLAEDYALIKAEADGFVARGALKRPDSQWHPPYDMLSSALVYLVERELGNENAEAYARAVIDVWGNGLVLSNIGNKHFGNNGIIYDWIYDAMTVEERVKYGDYLGGWLYWYTQSPEILLRNGDWLYNQTWGPAHLNIGNTRDGITPKLFVALAIHGAGTAREDASQSFLDSWEKRIPDECIPRFNVMGGVWSESFGHGSYGPARVIPWAFEAWRTATGQNFFELGTPTTYLKEMNMWATHLTVPFDNQTAPIDDNSGGDIVSSWIYTGPILGARYRDPVANYLASQYQRVTYEERWYYVPFHRFVIYDPEVAPKTPRQAGWPTARLFTGSGHTYMRSAWDDPEATWAFFGVGPWYAGHSRDDEGHFMIAKKGWLVLRAGGMGHNDNDYYAGGSLAFNIATIFDPDETFDRLSPGESALNSGGTQNERDGGMIRLLYSSSQGQVKNRGHITAFKHCRDYTYAAADLSAAYKSTKRREVSRQFLYLRGQREFFLIFDRVDARDAEFPKTWFLHIPGEPAISGTETKLTAGHVYSYTDATSATWLSDPAGSGNVLSSGRSRAFLKTVLPEGAVITKRGGEGHQFWGHPHEPTAQYNHEGSESHRTPIVPWRLEVEAPLGPERDYFLHVLEVGEEGDTEMSEVTLIEEDTSLVGVRIVPQTGSPVEVLFSRHGELTASIKSGDDLEFEQLPTEVDTTVDPGLRGDIDGNGKLELTDVIALLLLGREYPGDPLADFNGDGRYSITDAISLLLYMRAQNPGVILASASGLKSLSLSTEERAYLWKTFGSLGLTDLELSELRSILGPVNIPRSFSLSQNSPNPFNPSTTIFYTISDDRGIDVSLEVYNLRGQLIKVLVDRVHSSGEYRVTWDGKSDRGAEVSSGVYFYRLKAGANTTVKKMVVLR